LIHLAVAAYAEAHGCQMYQSQDDEGENDG
jgi:hypothetical protein